MYGIDRAIVRLAAEQHGAVTHRQAVSLGADTDLASRRLRDGHWSREAHGVYVVGGAPPTFDQRVMVARLAAGEEALISHRTAARLWNLLSGRAVPIEVTIPLRRTHRRRGTITHRSRDLHLADPHRVHGIPVTSPARTILDLGAVDRGAVRPAVWAALRQSLVTWPLLLHTLLDHSRRGRPGLGALRAVLSEHYGELATDSRTEDVAYAVLADAGRVPLPHKQVPVTCADGVEVSVDLGWPEYRALLEIYGADHLTNEDLQHLDLHRRNQIELAGFRLLVYTGRLVRRQPDQFVADVEALLRSCGWAPGGSVLSGSAGD